VNIEKFQRSRIFGGRLVTPSVPPNLLTHDPTPLAIRTLKLYVQIVRKAYQASKEGVSEEVDGDDLWVETLVYEIRTLYRNAAVSDDPESIEDKRYAETLVEKATSRLNKNEFLVASVFLAEVVCHYVMALKGKLVLSYH
jgi:hypothetical protein